MRTWIIAIGLILTLALWTAPSASATNITIFDEVSSDTGWHGSQEDNEVEPGCVTGQVWDLEGMVLAGQTLTIVAGFNVQAGYDGWDPGDLFIDVNGDALYGPPNGNSGHDSVVTNRFGYDLVLHRESSWATDGAYTVYELSPDSTVKTATVYYAQNDESNPWEYNSGGTLIGSGNADFFTSNPTGETFLGYDDNDTHYAVSFDLTSIWSTLAGNTATFHYTMECGNDNLMGQAAVPVPEPGSAILVLGGLALLAARRQKRRVK